jgi:hypothetical protein
MSSLTPSLEDLFHKTVEVKICPYGDCKVSQHFLPVINRNNFSFDIKAFDR